MNGPVANGINLLLQGDRDNGAPVLTLEPAAQLRPRAAESIVVTCGDRTTRGTFRIVFPFGRDEMPNTCVVQYAPQRAGDPVTVTLTGQHTLYRGRLFDFYLTQLRATGLTGGVVDPAAGPKAILSLADGEGPFTAPTFAILQTDFGGNRIHRDRIVATNATLSEFRAVPSGLVFKITPQSPGLVSLQAAAGAVTSATGVPSAATERVDMTFDYVAPTLALGRSDSRFETFEIVASGGRINPALNAGMIAMENAVITEIGEIESTSRTAIGYKRTGFGPITAAFAAGAAVRNGLPSPATGRLLLAPAVDVSRPKAFWDHQTGDFVKGTADLTLRFSEPVDGLEPGDFAVTGGRITAIADIGGGAVYRITTEASPIDRRFTDAFDRPGRSAGSRPNLRISLGADAVTSRASGQGNAAVDRLSLFADPHAPVAQFQLQDQFRPYEAWITFTEPVRGLDTGDFILLSASISNLRDRDGGSQFSFLVRPSHRNHQVLLPEGAVFDRAGNPNVATTAEVSPPPPPGPGLTISGVPEYVTPGEAITAIFTFEAPVTGFDASDIRVMGGHLTRLVEVSAGQSFAGQIVADLTDNLIIEVPDGAAMGAGDLPTRGAVAAALVRSSEAAQRLIGSFMANRTNALVSAQPDLSALARGQGDRGRFALVATRGQGSLSFHSGMKGPAWSAFEATWSDTGGASLGYALASFGAHRTIGGTTHLGAMLQLDFADQSEGAARISGTGWLVGPYVAAQLGEGPLFFDARLLYGRTRNKISPFGTYTDRFTTERWLAQANLSGQIERPGVTWLPHFRLSWAEDHQAAYVDGIGNPVPDQVFQMGQADVGLGFEVPLDRDRTVLTGGLSGIWSTTRGTRRTAATPAYSGGRARVELGIRRRLASGQMGLRFHLDGIGAPGYRAAGIAYDFEIAF